MRLPLALLAALLLLLAGCGDDPDTGPTRTAGHNDADVAFATGMIPHHGQALEMARLARDSATSAEVTKIAGAIEQAQDPEIRTMSAWLQSWGEPVPSPSMSGHRGHDATTMMTDAEMQQLRAARGPAFDRLWVELMIRHHEGAVAMSETELEQGQDPEAQALARRIIEAQSAEIAELKELLAELT